MLITVHNAQVFQYTTPSRAWLRDRLSLSLSL